MEDDQIRIVLKVPLINPKEKYGVFKVHNIPVPFYNTSKLGKVKLLLFKYELEAEVFLISKN